MTLDKPAPHGAWRSFHIFLWDAGKTDRFLAEIMLPLLREYGANVRWFFIRYWEGGPHIRLRLRADESVVNALISGLASAIHDYLSPGLLDPARYYRSHVFERPIGDIAAMPWFAEGAIEQIAYEPEIVRYGGPAALPHQEQLFELSSRLAAKIIIGTQKSWPRRAALAVQMMIAAADSVTDTAEDAGRFFLNYAKYWRAFANGDQAPPPMPDYETLNRNIRAPRNRTLPHIWLEALAQTNGKLLLLAADGALMSPLTGEPVTGAREADEALRTIAASQIHMLNNRLGIGPDREYAFALALSAAAGGVTNVMLNG